MKLAMILCIRTKYFLSPSLTFNHDVREVIRRHASPSTNQPRQQRQQRQPRQPKASSGSLVMLISISPQKYLFCLSLIFPLFSPLSLSLSFTFSPIPPAFSAFPNVSKNGRKERNVRFRHPAWPDKYWTIEEGGGNWEKKREGVKEGGGNWEKERERG